MKYGRLPELRIHQAKLLVRFMYFRISATSSDTFTMRTSSADVPRDLKDEIQGKFLPPPPSFSGAMRLRSVLQKYETDATKAALITDARRQFAKAVLGNEAQQSLRSMRLEAGLSRDQPHSAH